MSTIKANNISPIGSTLTLGGSLAGLTVAGGVTVSGAAYFSSGVTLNSALTVNSSATFNGAVTFGSTMTVTGGVTMSSLTKFSNGIQLGTSTLSNPNGSAPIYGARAWIVFNGFNLSVLNSANCTVARTTGFATGVYTITFTTAMPSANYVILANNVSYAQANQTVGNPQILAANTTNPVAGDTRYLKSASSFTIIVSNGSARYDLSEIYVAVFA
jgi:hypothetical protein